MQHHFPFDPREPRVVYRDADVLVLSKPAGMLTTTNTNEVSLVAVAKRLDPDAPQLHPTSRLDRQVCGLVVFSRHERANRRLRAARAEGRYRRAYLALSEKTPLPEQGFWRWPIAVDPRQNDRRWVADDSAQGKAATTVYRTLKRGKHAAALALFPQTGRTHQLRVHAAFSGCPLFGDKLYRGKQELVFPDGCVLWAPRVMLQCVAVHVQWPEGSLEWSLDIAADMVEFWKLSGENDECFSSEVLDDLRQGLRSAIP